MLFSKWWKRGLVFFVSGVLGLSLFFMLSLFKSVKSREYENAKLWIRTIKKQRELIEDVQFLFNDLNKEEQKKLKLWLKAVKRIPNVPPDDPDFDIVFDVIKNNEFVPLILTRGSGVIYDHRNIKDDSPEGLQRLLIQMKGLHPPLSLNLDGDVNYLYYGESKLHKNIDKVFQVLVKSYLSDIENNVVSAPVLYMDSTQVEVLAYGNLRSGLDVSNKGFSVEEQIAQLRKTVTPIKVGDEFLYVQETQLLLMLRLFPLVFVLIVLLIAIGVFLYLKVSDKNEQSLLWVGMSKETAHQLGTPISSLMAWNEILKDDFKDNIAFQEIQKDIDRLELITDRFSKIGSKPSLELKDLSAQVVYVMSYMESRISPHVKISKELASKIRIEMNPQLISWVIENLVKNSVDAMSGKGALSLVVFEENERAILEVSDSGNGIKKSLFKKIFSPGYSSKKRGWGLGLALAKRIIEEYHEGKIFVKSSAEGEGTIMRIEFILKP